MAPLPSSCQIRAAAPCTLEGDAGYPVDVPRKADPRSLLLLCAVHLNGRRLCNERPGKSKRRSLHGLSHGRKLRPGLSHRRRSAPHRTTLDRPAPRRRRNSSPSDGRRWTVDWRRHRGHRRRVRLDKTPGPQRRDGRPDGNACRYQSKWPVNRRCCRPLCLCNPIRAGAWNKPRRCRRTGRWLRWPVNRRCTYLRGSHVNDHPRLLDICIASQMEHALLARYPTYPNSASKEEQHGSAPRRARFVPLP